MGLSEVLWKTQSTINAGSKGKKKSGLNMFQEFDWNVVFSYVEPVMPSAFQQYTFIEYF